mmetsp:Transcript_27314/g.24195  ORF Transcript_27314/g.24195 Transcript_27314/m.24195 type:complete len:127 (+) Transcript_27314:253-633(+)
MFQRKQSKFKKNLKKVQQIYQDLYKPKRSPSSNFTLRTKKAKGLFNLKACNTNLQKRTFQSPVRKGDYLGDTYNISDKKKVLLRLNSGSTKITLSESNLPKNKNNTRRNDDYTPFTDTITNNNFNT